MDRLLDLLLPRGQMQPEGTKEEVEARRVRTKEKLKGKLEKGELDAREVTIQTSDRSKPVIEIFSGTGLDEMGVNFPDELKHLMPRRKKDRVVTVQEAKKILHVEEMEKLVDMDAVTSRALRAVEESGIVFIDELDKAAGAKSAHGPDVSREGVQRDILPIVEGSSVNTKYGVVKTDHIHFIAAGAFHMSKPSDLIPELQGRFPIRVELKALTAADFERILTEPENALIKQYSALIGSENVEIEFTAEAVREVARIAALVNRKMENIGARRLHTVLTTLLEDILFELPDASVSQITVDARMVTERLDAIVEDEDLARYIL